MNLLINAMDALPQGGRIQFSTALTLADHDGVEDRVRVEIRDNGVGIPTAHLDSIFNPFFSTKESGSGIGLPLSLGIIENHGGTLNVEPCQESGTLAVFELPIGSQASSKENHS